MLFLAYYILTALCMFFWLPMLGYLVELVEVPPYRVTLTYWECLLKGLMFTIIVVAIGSICFWTWHLLAYVINH